MKPPQPTEPPDSIAVVNGKRYSLWPQFVHRKEEWIGGLLQDLDETGPGPCAPTKIKDITFLPNGSESAMFGVVGEDYECCTDVHHLAVDPRGEPGWITFFSRFGSWRIKKPELKAWYFTFGQKYREEPHPAGGHPDGWFEVWAVDSDSAREKMFALCGPQWGAQYDFEPSTETYRRGKLKEIR